MKTTVADAAEERHGDEIARLNAMFETIESQVPATDEAAAWCIAQDTTYFCRQSKRPLRFIVLRYTVFISWL